MLHTFYVWTVLQSLKFSRVLFFSLAVFLRASLHSVEMGSVAVTPSFEGLSQDVSLMGVGKAGALMLA